MNNIGINRVRSKIGWLTKRRNLKSVGLNTHVGYGLVFKNPQYIEIGDNFTAGKDLKIEAWDRYKDKMFSKTPSVIIGKNVSIMDDCQISCCSSVTLGDGCLFGNNVFITDNYHGDNSLEQLSIPPADRPLFVKGGVHIGNNVWVGRNVCIMPGVNIGDGTVIGANSVVTHDIPAYSVAVGSPARVIKIIKEN